MHNPTKYITLDTLIKALDEFKPSIILIESDTSLINDKGNFKMTAQQIDNSPEEKTLQVYRQKHPQVMIRSFDIADRNKFYKEHNTFCNENKMSKVIDSLHQKNMLNDTSWFIANALYSANQILNDFG